MSQLLDQIGSEADQALRPTQDQRLSQMRAILEAKKEELTRDRQSLADRRANLDAEEASFAGREQELTDASNELEAMVSPESQG